MDAGIIEDPPVISKVGRDSPVDVAAKTELPNQRFEVGRPLVEVRMLQLEDDNNVDTDVDHGIGGDDRSSGD